MIKDGRWLHKYFHIKCGPEGVTGFSPSLSDQPARIATVPRYLYTFINVTPVSIYGGGIRVRSIVGKTKIDRFFTIFILPSYFVIRIIIIIIIYTIMSKKRHICVRWRSDIPRYHRTMIRICLIFSTHRKTILARTFLPQK